jgi:hypothetical protein
VQSPQRLLALQLSSMPATVAFGQRPPLPSRLWEIGKKYIEKVGARIPFRSATYFIRVDGVS